MTQRAAADTSRSMTPAESESQLKTYLASKLMGGGESTRSVSFEFGAILHVMTEMTPTQLSKSILSMHTRGYHYESYVLGDVL